MALLSLPHGKQWQQEDLNSPKVLMIVLRSVYNRIRGVQVLHLGTSIHIKYDEVSTSQLGRLGELFERGGG
ncbi:SNF2-like protein [Penicillium concentricum]|uniref:SNF2-like protein n=1 Tax=Penicillium concentricum TaxID=293559 RepID=A0A9W9VBB3_9EURO|nr:SNF2-like protein [Penicillium concentricum]KAJ5373270.1 SNF2-like protein [Penicillium concentricum]